MADSLPGEPLYGLKLLVAEQRLRWTSDPQERVDLALNAVGERLNEIADTIESGQTIDQSTNSMLQKHLGMALNTVDQQAQDPLQTMTQHQATIQSWHRRVVQAMGTFPGTDREPLRALANRLRDSDFTVVFHAHDADPLGVNLGPGGQELDGQPAQQRVERVAGGVGDGQAVHDQGKLEAVVKERRH